MIEAEQMPVTDHLIELRKRIIWVVLTFIVAMAISFPFASDIFTWIRQDSLQDVKIHALSPGDSLKIYVQISFICATVFTIPVILYHLWQFVRPGLQPKEQRAALLYIPVAILLFLCGLLFGYYIIFPYLIEFAGSLNQQLQAEEMYGIYQYFGFMLNIILPLAIFFELPVIVLFLTYIRLLTPQLLRKMRRVAYLLMVIIAAMITPPDVISNILVGIPLVVLYEISIWLSTWLYRRIDDKGEEEK